MHREPANRPAPPSGVHHFVPFSNRAPSAQRYRDHHHRQIRIKKSLAESACDKAKDK